MRLLAEMLNMVWCGLKALMVQKHSVVFLADSEYIQRPACA